MPKKVHGRCLVCDDVAIGINFGVATCMPCKAFFRRNASKVDTKRFICAEEGNCMITYEHRRLCGGCRLAKCFDVGMKPSLILSDEKREARNALVEENRSKRGAIARSSKTEQNQKLALVQIYRSSIETLSPSDQIVLVNISDAYETTCLKVKDVHSPSFPAVEHTSLHTFINEVGVVFPWVVNYMKHIPEFTNIRIDDQVRLIKNHFGLMINLSEPLMYPQVSANLVRSWTNVFGGDITVRLLKRNQTIEQFTIEPMILKLVLIIVVFWNDIHRNVDDVGFDAICDDTLSLFKTQRIYIELLWKYILSRSSTYRDAVQLLNRLVMLMLYVQKLDSDTHDHINNCEKEIEQMEPMMQCMFPTTCDD